MSKETPEAEDFHIEPDYSEFNEDAQRNPLTAGRKFDYQYMDGYWTANDVVTGEIFRVDSDESGFVFTRQELAIESIYKNK